MDGKTKIEHRSSAYGKGSPNRVLVIGLDGATFSLIDRWILGGTLRNLASLRAHGTAHNLISTIPSNTAPAWSSIITGKNPGKHAIFDFWARAHGRYEMVPVNATFRKSKDVWEVLSEHHRKIVTINVPLTYPPRSVDGCMISGPFIPDGVLDFVYPSSARQMLRQSVGEFDSQPRETSLVGRERAFIDDVTRTTRCVADASLFMIENLEWDFFMVVFFDTDRMGHALWGYSDPSHPNYATRRGRVFRHELLKYYLKLDSIIGEFLKRIDRKETVVLVVSDHGMGPIFKQIDVNNLLAKMGFLKFLNRPRTVFRRAMSQCGITPINVYKFFMRMRADKFMEEIVTESRIVRSSGMPVRITPSFEDVDWSNTAAYSFGSGQLYVNVRGREPEGVIQERHMNDIMRKVTSAFLEARDPGTGHRLFTRVLTKDRIYHGRYVSEAPDIVLEPNPVYSFFKHPFVSNSVLGKSVDKSADHRLHGIFLLSGPDVNREVTGGFVQSIDVAPTILYLLGVPIPVDMDGRVLTELLQQNYVQTHPIRTGPAADRVDSSFMTLEEQNHVEDRLRRLGYM